MTNNSTFSRRLGNKGLIPKKLKYSAKQFSRFRAETLYKYVNGLMKQVMKVLIVLWFPSGLMHFQKINKINN